MANCGYFDDAKREYVITTPFTPVKWINYVGTLAFGGIVDHTGGALICQGDPANNRLTKYLPQLPASDFRGSTIYVRVGTDLWSPFYTPVLAKLDKWECRVGLGYNTWVAERGGVRLTVKVYVASGDAASPGTYVQDVTVENIAGRPLTIDVIPVVEFTHFDALKQLTNADWVPQTMTVKAHQLAGVTVLEQYAFMKRDLAVNWFATTLPATSFDSDRKVFLGHNEYGSWAHPGALDQPQLNNSTALRGDNIGALQVSLGTLAPGSSKRFAALLGQTAKIADAAAVITKLSNLAHLDANLKTLAAGWATFLDVLTVKTPDAAFDSMVNVHNPRQCHTTKNWSRDLSLYQLGLGGRGMGYRDSSQDVLGAMTLMPGECRVLIEKILSVQKREGNAMHQFYPLTMEASVGDSHEYPDRPHWYGDDHLWPVFSVAAYLRETGDLAWLDKSLPFYEKDAAKKPFEAASIYEHLKRAVEFTRTHVGAHGLPLLGFADWNDTVNLPTGAESLFIANQYGKAVRDLQEIARARGDHAYATELEAAWTTMRDAFEKAGWDGEWYVRYFKADGSPIGSHNADKGKIWINSNTWAVLSGFASADRAATALESVNKHLNTKYGLKLSAPGYNGFDRDIGGVTTYPPGAKENGGIFLHTNPWAMIAETLMGNGDRAHQYYTAINPAAKNDVIGMYEAEPYCYPQNILGDEHPQFGLARNTWLSGTSSWTYVASTQFILGVRPEIEGLRVDPCIPKAWPGFEVTRQFRGARYHITVKNPRGVSKGVVAMTLDGRSVPGNLIPCVDDRQQHVVEITLG
ncbi:MAG: glycosyl transferase [Spirochaetales bacterium]